jgi:Rrf2 family cysteine metabolism transcriptional repressor
MPKDCGYWLARPAEEIGMDEVVQALEGSIAPMECFVHERTERVLCSHEPDAGRGCATKLLWTRVQGGIIRSLQTTTLAELVQFAGGPIVASPAPVVDAAALALSAPAK